LIKIMVYSISNRGRLLVKLNESIIASITSH
jgi:hypothetical protein